MEKGGKGVWRWWVGGGGGKREIIYLSIHCHHQNDSRIKTGSDESHFNVSFIVRRDKSHRTVSTNHNLFEQKGEPKRIRTEILLLPSLTPYRQAKHAPAAAATAAAAAALHRRGQQAGAARRLSGL